MLKVVPALLGDDSRKRFMEEATASARLQHDNTVSVFDYGEIDLSGIPAFYIAMQHIDGMRLSSLLEGGQALSLPQALWVATEIVAGLTAAHQVGIMHCDLKPENILVQSTPTVRLKVLGFGLGGALSENAAGLSMSGRIVGAPEYMAPEQVLTSSADTRTDIYALGVLLFRMVTGQLPFDDVSRTRIMMAHIRDPIPSLPEDCLVPEEVEQLIQLCLQKEPDKRFASIEALAEALAALPVAPDPAGLAAQCAVAAAPMIEEEPDDDALDDTLTIDTLVDIPSEERRWLPLALLGILGAAALLLVWGLGILLKPPSLTRPESTASSVVVEVPLSATEVATVPEPLTLTLRSEPLGATVMEGDEVLGTTPLTLVFDPIGSRRRFALERDGYHAATVVWDPATPLVLPLGALERLPPPSRLATDAELDIRTER